MYILHWNMNVRIKSFDFELILHIFTYWYGNWWKWNTNSCQNVLFKFIKTNYISPNWSLITNNLSIVLQYFSNITYSEKKLLLIRLWNLLSSLKKYKVSTMIMIVFENNVWKYCIRKTKLSSHSTSCSFFASSLI